MFRRWNAEFITLQPHHTKTRKIPLERSSDNCCKEHCKQSKGKEYILQELSSLRKSKSIVAIFELRICCDHLADHFNLSVAVQQEAIFNVLEMNRIKE